MTFKTRYKIGQEVIHAGAVLTILTVEIKVTAESKDVIYRMSDGEKERWVNELILLDED